MYDSLMGGRQWPFRFQLFVYEPGRRVIGFHLVLDPRSIYRAGIIGGITNVFASRGIPIINFAVSLTPFEKNHCVLYVDLSNNEDVDVMDLLSDLKHVPYVVDVILIKPLFDGFVANPYFFPLIFGDERAVIFLKRGYEGLIKHGRKKLGSGFDAILYLEGYNLGANTFLRWYKELADKSSENLLKMAKTLFQQVGYGIIVIESVNTERAEAIIRIYDNFECELFRGSDKPESHLVRGMIAGWFSQFFNKNVIAIETKCIAKGDPYCEFQIKPK